MKFVHNDGNILFENKSVRFVNIWRIVEIWLIWSDEQTNILSIKTFYDIYNMKPYISKYTL